jgi:nitrogen fixation/metabolism regulation signal transduction histidine kinase
MATAVQNREQPQMEQLLAGLTAVRGGDFSTRLPEADDPLMNEIAAVFNAMNEQLAVFTSEVTRHRPAAGGTSPTR